MFVLGSSSLGRQLLLLNLSNLVICVCKYIKGIIIASTNECGHYDRSPSYTRVAVVLMLMLEIELDKVYDNIYVSVPLKASTFCTPF